VVTVKITLYLMILNTEQDFVSKKQIRIRRTFEK